MWSKIRLLLSTRLLRARLRASLLPQGSGWCKSLQIRSITVLITPIPTPTQCLPTSPNEEKALKPSAVHYFSVIEGKKQMRACHAVMVHKQLSTMEPSFLSRAEPEAGTWEFCKAVCSHLQKVGVHQLCPLRSICCGDPAGCRAIAHWATHVKFLLVPL